MRLRASPTSSLVRLILALSILGQAVYVPVYGSVVSNITVNVRPNTANPPGTVTGIVAAPDYSSPEGKGKIRLQWNAPGAENGTDDVFSYVVKYATFSVADMGGNTLAWWNNPNTLTALDPELPSSWGLKATAPRNNTETFGLSGFADGTLYYFGVKSVDRYKRYSDYDDPMRGIVTQANAYSTTPPWMPSNITTLTALALTDRGQARLQWTAPLFIDTSGFLVSGKIKYSGQYCVQYSTVNTLTTGQTITDAHPEAINKPDDTNNWLASTRLFIDTRNVTSNDFSQYILTGLNMDTTYYVHVFTRSDWPNKWSIASLMALVKPRVVLTPIQSVTAIATGSASTAVGSYISLTWTNPAAEPNLKGTRITYSTTAYPDTPSWPNYIDVEPLTAGQTTTYQHIQLLPRTSYFYTLYAYDNTKYFSNGVSVSTYTGVDKLAPDAVQNLTGLISGVTVGTTVQYAITLNWTTPPAAPAYMNSDYTGARIYYSTSTANPALQALLANITGTNAQAQQYAHNNLSILTTYYYSVFTYDQGGLVSTTPATASFYISEQYIPPSKPTLVTALASMVTNADVGASVFLRWTSPAEIQTSGVTVVMRTDRYAAGISDVQDSSLVHTWTGSPNVTAEYTYVQLFANTTYYVSLFASSKYGLVSQPTTVSLYTRVPWSDAVGPYMPLAIRMLGSSGTARTLGWNSVRYNEDRSRFVNPDSPRIDELISYRILRSTSIVSANWDTVAIVRSTMTAYADTLPGNAMYYYKVRSCDATGNYNDSFIMSSEGDIIIYNGDGSYLWLDPAAAAMLNRENNAIKNDVQVKFTENGTDEVGPVIKSIDWAAYRVVETTPTLSLVKLDNFSVPAVAGSDNASGTLALSYQVGSSNSAANAPAVKFMTPQEASAKLSMYYFNGVEWLKLGSSVNAEYKTVNAKSKFAGKYQLRVASPATEFTFFGVMPKLITPNQDGQNDRVMFRYANPKGSPVTIKIFDIKGALVKQLQDSTKSSDVQGEYLYWDGTDKDNLTVNPGVYIYQLEGEGKTVNGTIVVAR